MWTTEDFGQPGDGEFDFIEAAFINRGTVVFPQGTEEFERQFIGEVDFDDGRWILVEPDSPYWEEPFNLPIPPGRHKIFATLARPCTSDTFAYDPGRPVVAYATLQISDLVPSEFYGFARFGTDTATGAFLSASAWKRWHDALVKDAGLWERLRPAQDLDAPFQDRAIDGHRILSFTTGVGDGFYNIYVAARGDSLVGIVADFKTLVRHTRTDVSIVRKE